MTVWSVSVQCGQSVVSEWSLWSVSVQCGQCSDSLDSSPCGTEAMTLERMTDRDVSFNSEAKHQQRTEVWL